MAGPEGGHPVTDRKEFEAEHVKSSKTDGDLRLQSKDEFSNKEIEKRDRASSKSSEPESPMDEDVEKVAPMIATTTEELPDPADPNVVDWEGPDDPENPQNW